MNTEDLAPNRNVSTGLLQQALRHGNTILFRTDTELRYVWVHHHDPAFDTARMIGKRLDELAPPESVATIFRQYERSLRQEERVETDGEYVREGKPMRFHIITEPVYDEGMRLIGIEGVVIDRTEVEDAQRRSALLEEIRTLAERIGQMGSFQFEVRTGIVTISDEIPGLLGIPAEFLNGIKRPADIFKLARVVRADFRRTALQRYRELVQAKRPYDIRVPILLPDGKERWLRVTIEIIQRPRKRTWVVGVIKDVTESMLDSLRKDRLLAETHHRVKNNLAVVAGLLGMQAEETRDPHAMEALANAASRLRAVSDVHELLYRSSDLAHIDAHTYLNQVCASVRATWPNLLVNLTYTCTSDPVQWSIDRALPIGLMLNELLTNSWKYAFVGRSQGAILVRLTHDADGYQFLYEDDGNGRADIAHVFQASGTLGVNLITGFVAQIGGTYQVSTREDGTGFRFVCRWPESLRA